MYTVSGGRIYNSHHGNCSHWSCCNWFMMKMQGLGLHLLQTDYFRSWIEGYSKNSLEFNPWIKCFQQSFFWNHLFFCRWWLHYCELLMQIQLILIFWATGHGTLFLMFHQIAQWYWAGLINHNSINQTWSSTDPLSKLKINQ